jgi:hypothetical protein
VYSSFCFVLSHRTCSALAIHPVFLMACSQSYLEYVSATSVSLAPSNNCLHFSSWQGALIIFEKYARTNYLYVWSDFVHACTLTPQTNCLIHMYPYTLLAATCQVYCANEPPGHNLRFRLAIPHCSWRRAFEDIVIALRQWSFTPSPICGWLVLLSSTISSTQRDDEYNESSHWVNCFWDLGDSKLFWNSNISFRAAIWDLYWRLFFYSPLTFDFPPFLLQRRILHPVKTGNTRQLPVRDQPKGSDWLANAKKFFILQLQTAAWADFS